MYDVTMFEPDKEEINKKCVKMFTIQNNLLGSCQELKDFVKKIKEQKLKNMTHQNKKRKTSM